MSMTVPVELVLAVLFSVEVVNIHLLLALKHLFNILGSMALSLWSLTPGCSHASSLSYSGYENQLIKYYFCSKQG